MKKCRERRLGKPLYIAEPVKVRLVGSGICSLCGLPTELRERKGYGFRTVLSVCENGHAEQLEKELYQKFSVGDVVRVYNSSFGKDSVLRLHTFDEGEVVSVYPNIIDYDFDFRIDKSVHHGKELPPESWVYGHIVKGHSSHSRDVRLIRKVNAPTGEEG